MPASYEMIIKGLVNDTTPVQNSWIINTPEAENDFATCEEIDILVQTNGWIDAWLDCCPTLYKITAIEVRGIVLEGGGSLPTPAFVDFVPGLQGTRTGAVCSNQDNPMISMFPEIVVGERARVNKTFIPGVTITDAIDDVIQSGLLTKIVDFLDAIELGLILAGGTGDFVCRVRSLLDPTQPPDPDTNPYLYFVRRMISTAYETFVASQNRRRPTR